MDGSDPRLGLIIRIRSYPDEIDRFRILYLSLLQHAPWRDLSEIIVISPDQTIQKALRTLPSSLGGPIPGRIEWILETDRLILNADNYLSLETEVVNVNPWRVEDILTRPSMAQVCSRSVQCYSRLFGHAWSGLSEDLVRRVDSPEEIFEGTLPEEIPFLVYPRSTQLSPAIIYDLVRARLGDPLSRDLPLISCVMVTKDRLNYVKLAIKSFQNQTYPQKELVIISDSFDGVEAYLDQIKDPQISFIRPAQANLKLGQLRNLSLDRARGKYVCQWDDDDWYHPSRLSLQYQALLSNRARVCLLSQWMLISPRTGQYGISPVRREGWEGSLLAQKDILPRYPHLKRAEDRKLIQTLQKTTRIHVIDQPGYWMLYGYVIHQKNTWNDQHFQRILSERIPLSVPWPGRVEGIARYLAQRHSFEYQGYQEDHLPVVSMFLHRIDWVWLIIILIAAIVWVWLSLHFLGPR